MSFIGKSLIKALHLHISDEFLSVCASIISLLPTQHLAMIESRICGIVSQSSIYKRQKRKHMIGNPEVPSCDVHNNCRFGPFLWHISNDQCMFLKVLPLSTMRGSVSFHAFGSRSSMRQRLSSRVRSRFRFPTTDASCGLDKRIVPSLSIELTDP
jgi:hypothetical protein